MTLSEILNDILPAERGIYKSKDKPIQYITFLRISKNSALQADDETDMWKEVYRVNLFSKVDFEERLEELTKKLKKAGYYMSVDTEDYEVKTGYWKVPITVEYLKE